MSVLTELRIQNFRSWKDTGTIRLAPLTGLFGANSSGKSAILQLLLLLDETVRSTDERKALELGDKMARYGLSDFEAVVRGHDRDLHLSYCFQWERRHGERNGSGTSTVRYEAELVREGATAAVDSFRYTLPERDTSIGMVRERADGWRYRPEASGIQLEARVLPGQTSTIPHVGKSYIFPREVYTLYDGVEEYAWLPLAFERLFQDIRYLGPLRAEPEKRYAWAEGRPSDVGRRGERTIGALVGSRLDDEGAFQPEPSHVEAKVAHWLQEMDLLHSFDLVPLDARRQVFEVRVRRTKRSPEVHLLDVGFGVSQVLPVLVQLFYAQPGSILLMEHPEVHLHPRAQAGLVDAMIEAVTSQGIQLIIESHSEYLLHRLQRRIAEQAFDDDRTALYFTQLAEGGESQLTELDVDPYGNIRNWPPDFFGTTSADLIEMTKAEIRRRELDDAE
jgi:predicted ATPase